MNVIGLFFWSYSTYNRKGSAVIKINSTISIFWDRTVLIIVKYLKKIRTVRIIGPVCIIGNLEYVLVCNMYSNRISIFRAQQKKYLFNLKFDFWSLNHWPTWLILLVYLWYLSNLSNLLGDFFYTLFCYTECQSLPL